MNVTKVDRWRSGVRGGLHALRNKTESSERLASKCFDIRLLICFEPTWLKIKIEAPPVNFHFGGQCRLSAVHLFQGERNTDLGIAWPLKLGRLVHFTFLPADGEGVSTRHGHVFRKFGDMEIRLWIFIHTSLQRCSKRR